MLPGGCGGLSGHWRDWSPGGGGIKGGHVSGRGTGFFCGSLAGWHAERHLGGAELIWGGVGQGGLPGCFKGCNAALGVRSGGYLRKM